MGNGNSECDNIFNKLFFEINFNYLKKYDLSSCKAESLKASA